MQDAEKVGPELPTGKAFVLRLNRETDATLRRFAGRLEHVSTGRRVRFDTLEGLLAALTRLLNAPREP